MPATYATTFQGEKWLPSNSLPASVARKASSSGRRWRRKSSTQIAITHHAAALRATAFRGAVARTPVYTIAPQRPEPAYFATGNGRPNAGQRHWRPRQTMATNAMASSALSRSPVTAAISRQDGGTIATRGKSRSAKIAAGLPANVLQSGPHVDGSPVRRQPARGRDRRVQSGDRARPQRSNVSHVQAGSLASGFVAMAQVEIRDQKIETREGDGIESRRDRDRVRRHQPAARPPGDDLDDDRDEADGDQPDPDKRADAPVRQGIDAVIEIETVERGEDRGRRSARPIVKPALGSPPTWPLRNPGASPTPRKRRRAAR